MNRWVKRAVSELDCALRAPERSASERHHGSQSGPKPLYLGGRRLSDLLIASHTESIEKRLEMLLSDGAELSLSGRGFLGLWVKAKNVLEIRWP